MGKFDGILLLSDMDGTLLDTKGSISRENRRAIDYFSQNGGKFSVATGRVKLGMEHFLEDFELSAPAVIYNGAVIYDFVQDKSLDAQQIGHDGYELACDLLPKYPDMGFEVSLIDDEYVAQVNDITVRHLEYVKIELKVREAEKIPQPWIKLNLTLDPAKMPELREYLARKYGHRFFMQHSMPYFYEISKKGADKGAAALRLCDILDISRDNLYVAGDGLNDVELMSCTKNAYAPSNGEESIKAMAKGLLPANGDHAIAALIDIIENDLR